MLVNGEELVLNSLSKVHNLRDLVLHLQMQPEIVAIDINGEIPKRQDWENILLKEEDKIEIIRFVGGG